MNSYINDGKVKFNIRNKYKIKYAKMFTWGGGGGVGSIILNQDDIKFHRDASEESASRCKPKAFTERVWETEPIEAVTHIQVPLVCTDGRPARPVHFRSRRATDRPSCGNALRSCTFCL